MDYASCYVIYVDKTARGDRLVKKDTTPSAQVSTHSNASNYFDTAGETEEVQANLQAILAVFNEGKLPAELCLKATWQRELDSSESSMSKSETRRLTQHSLHLHHRFYMFDQTC